MNFRFVVTILKRITLKKKRDSSFEQTWISFSQESFVPNLLGSWEEDF